MTPSRNRVRATCAAVSLLVVGLAACANTADPPENAPASVRPQSQPRAAMPREPVVDASPLFPLLAHSPLPGTLVLTGSFGEHRNSHLHAGLDFSTGGEVGMPVFASEAGLIERVRAAGAGYGRSIYIRAADGRLLVLAHLDAFDEPLASYVSAAQDSGGVYEQDLWPEAGRFPVKAGQRVGWSGRSGTGSPHLHFEVRRGDMALNPMRAGLDVPDATVPELRAITLEPLDERSFVNRSQVPWALGADAGADTVVLEGRARVVVQVVDPGERRAGMAPWGAGIQWGDHWYEWRADSISWATDLAEVDEVYDLGRAAPFAKNTLRLWAGPGARPRMGLTNADPSDAAGVIEAAPRDPPRALSVFARDLAGHLRERKVWVRGPSPGEEGTTSAAPEGDDLAFAPLPDARLRVRDGARGMAIVAARGGNDTLAGGWRIDEIRSGRLDDLAVWTVDSRTLTGRPAWAVRRESPGPGAPAELRARSDVLAMLPVRPPLRTAISLRFARPRTPGSDERLAVYRQGEEGWEFAGKDLDPGSGDFVVETRRLGRFALFEDTLPPRITPLAAPRKAPSGPYSTWALTARLAEDGSGIVARGCWFVVDGRRVPAEWDGVRSELRWRPRRAPAAGRHRYEVVAADRAGNVARRTGTFVLD